MLHYNSGEKNKHKQSCKHTSTGMSEAGHILAAAQWEVQCFLKKTKTIVDMVVHVY